MFFGFPINQVILMIPVSQVISVIPASQVIPVIPVSKVIPVIRVSQVIPANAIAVAVLQTGFSSSTCRHYQHNVSVFPTFEIGNASVSNRNPQWPYR